MNARAGAVVLRGKYLWAGAPGGEVRIVRSSTRWGSGDDEDEANLAEDQAIETYYVWFESLSEPGSFNTCLGAQDSLEQARVAAEAAAGIGTSIVWTEGADELPECGSTT